jgi:threonine dehydrogenase-like Zn-dependent dehydrogenase
MRGLTLDGVGVITYRTDLIEPTIELPTDAVVEVQAAGLCGSDLHPYQGRERVRFGVVAGHEVVGRVVAAGTYVTEIVIGDRVLVPFTTNCGECDPCRSGLSARCDSGRLFGFGDPDRPAAPALQGGQAERVRVPLAESTLMPVPNLISDEQAVLLADNFPTGWYAAERAGIVPGRSAAVVGLGSVGICATVAAVSMGATPVLAIDPLPDRRRRAGLLGAQTASPDEARPVHSFGSVIEAAGTPVAQELAGRLVRAGGTLSIISVPTTDRFQVTPIEAYDRNLTIRTGRAPVRSILERLLGRVVAGELTVPGDLVLTHPRVPLEQGAETYRRFAAREPGFLKAAFLP